mgnify:CR=1 FL=1
MNKEELSAMVADILKTMAPEPAVKAAPYHPTAPEPTPQDTAQPDSFVPDITRLDLRRLYLTENPADGPRFLAMKAKTPARLGCGRAGARYKTLTMLRFRADHAAAQDTVFSQVPEDYGASHGFVAVQTRCQSKDQYLTRPDLGGTFDAENLAILQKALPKNPQVQLVIGDGLSSAAILANAADCLAAIQEGLKLRHIECGKPVFVRYCRVGAGDVIGDYSFEQPIRIGDQLVFEDMAIYSMVKNNTFNGMPLPGIALLKEDGSVEMVREFGYDDFKMRL